MIVGIIGAENSHAAAIAKSINAKKRIKGVSVEYIWGETKKFAIKAADEGHIPYIVSRPSEMLDKVDAVIVDHRHGKYHLKAALPFIKKGLPVFVDKPFCCRAEEGVKFLKIARKYNAPVTSFGVVPLQKSFFDFTKKTEKLGKIHCATIYGPCDIKSQYGGVFFYGIHQVEMALFAFGYDVDRVLVTKNGKNAVSQLFYKDGKTITLNFIESGCNTFAISAVGDRGVIHENIIYDKEIYLSGTKKIIQMFKTEIEPLSHKQLLRPVEVLEAIERSVNTGKYEKI